MSKKTCPNCGYTAPKVTSHMQAADFTIGDTVTLTLADSVPGPRGVFSAVVFKIEDGYVFVDVGPTDDPWWNGRQSYVTKPEAILSRTPGTPETVRQAEQAQQWQHEQMTAAA
ncbi:hypothetical protein ACU686_26145 [Yinghuangia aomiensis]